MKISRIRVILLVCFFSTSAAAYIPVWIKELILPDIKPTSQTVLSKVYNSSATKEPGTLRIMTFNVRYKNNEEKDEREWSSRLPYIIELIRYYQPDIIGFQEPLYDQVTDLERYLSNDYNWFGKSRKKLLFSSIPYDEFNPIFYRKDRVKLLDQSTFWLNPDMEEYEKGWNASLPRICTWGKFFIPEFNKNLWVFNTHLSTSPEAAIINAGELVAKVMKQKVPKNEPALMIGDFNTSMANSKLAKIILGVTYGFVDTKTIAAKKEGPTGTYTNWNTLTTDVVFDHELLDKKDILSVSRHVVLQRSDSVLVSDHRAVFVDVKFK